MTESPGHEFEQLRKVKVTLSGDEMLIADKPKVWNILSIFLGVFLVVYAFYIAEDYNREWVMFGFGLLTLVCLWNALALMRVKIDLKERVVYRKSINPVANLLDRILQRPSRIPFGNIEGIFADYIFGMASAGGDQPYVYLRTDDPYKLRLCWIAKKADAERFAAFLHQKVRRK